MKNTIKMSLVAALAVAGLSTSASAGGLENAIKGVSISGKMEVEYDYESTNAGTPGATDQNSNSWDYDLDVTAKVPVNDQVTAVIGMEADHGKDVHTVVDTSNSKSSVDVSKLYFMYANGPVTTMIGKQGMAGAPWFDDEKANGLVGLYNAGPVTLAAAHFTGINAKVGDGVINTGGGVAAIADEDVSALAVIGSMGPVNASLWYAHLSNTADSFSVNANATFGMFGFDLTHTDTDYSDFYASGTQGGTDASLTKFVATADLGMFDLRAGYGTTNDDANRGAGVDLTDDGDAANNFASEQLRIDDLRDSDAFLIGATLTIDAWKFDLSHLDGEYKPGNADVDFEETLLDVEYKMSKNFTIDAFYSTAEVGNADMDSASVALEYKF